MKKFFENNKIYCTIIIILIVILIGIILTGGIQVGVTISEKTVRDSGGPLEPSDTGSVSHSETKLLIVNLIILLLSIIFSIYGYAIDHSNKSKLMILAFILLLALLTPIFSENNYENQITIAGEREDMRTDYGNHTMSLIQKILNGSTN